MATKKIDSTLLVLREIRDGIKATNTRLDVTNTRVDDLAGEVRATNKHLIEMEMRLATEMVAVAGAVRDVTALVREMRDGKINELEQRITAVERKVG
jgi:hypothetical protein